MWRQQTLPSNYLEVYCHLKPSSCAATDQPHPWHAARAAEQAPEPAPVHWEGGGGVQELSPRWPCSQDQSSASVSGLSVPPWKGLLSSEFYFMLLVFFQDGPAVCCGLWETHWRLWRPNWHLWAVGRSSDQPHLPRAFPLWAGEGTASPCCWHTLFVSCCVLLLLSVSLLTPLAIFHQWTFSSTALFNGFPFYHLFSLVCLLHWDLPIVLIFPSVPVFVTELPLS